MTQDPLHIGLWLLGAAVIGVVWLYNRWLTQRHTPRRSDLVTHTVDSEPHLHDAGMNPVESALPEATVQRDPESTASAGLGAVHAAASIDPQLDAVATLSLEHDVVSGDAILAALPGSRRVGSKPFAVEGLHVSHGQWEPPLAGQRYSALRVGLQLANRSGALNEIEYSEYVVKVQSLADALGAEVDFPDMMDEVQRARELDQFANAHDAQLGLTLVATRAAWSPGYLAQHAAALGFVSGALPGRMVLPGSQPGAAPVLVLQYETQLALADDLEQVALRECQISLDVPHVARLERPFVRLREVAEQLARLMEGVVTDGAGQVPTSPSLDAIGAELETLYEALAARGLSAGSPLARRLFS